MNDLPDNVLGISGEGKITGADYETILIPAVEDKLKKHKKISLLYYLGNDYTGFDLKAMFDDAKIGFKHLSDWEKIALVSDHELINTSAKLFGFLLPCKLRTFNNKELEEAKKWIIE
jgi:hypothetical protein